MTVLFREEGLLMEDRGNTILLDLTTPEGQWGCSSSILFRTDRTCVFYGGLHADVEMFDLGLQVRMDADREGNWSNEEWARDRAKKALAKALSNSCEALMALIKAKHAAGVKEGKETARREIRESLGIVKNSGTFQPTGDGPYR